MKHFHLEVPCDFEGEERLDKYVSSQIKDMNRSKLKSGLSNLFVDKKSVKLSFKVKAKNVIDIDWDDNVPLDILPEDIPLDIIFEDEDVCVINKAQGMVVHPACGNWSGTLVNALLYHWGRDKIEQNPLDSLNNIIASRRPGIVHRLDKETSGIIITAKNRKAEEYLQEQFKSRRGMIKEYIAICIGQPPGITGCIKTQIIRDPKNRKLFLATSDTEEGKYAETLYRCIAMYDKYSLMVFRLKTGRTHQIRVHAKYISCPILGDSLYGHVDKNFKDASLMLHSRKLRILLPPKEPGKLRPTVFCTKTPKRFLKVLKVLHSRYKKRGLDKK